MYNPPHNVMSEQYGFVTSKSLVFHMLRWRISSLLEDVEPAIDQNRKSSLKCSDCPLLVKLCWHGSSIVSAKAPSCSFSNSHSPVTRANLWNSSSSLKYSRVPTWKLDLFQRQKYSSSNQGSTRCQLTRSFDGPYANQPTNCRSRDHDRS